LATQERGTLYDWKPCLLRIRFLLPRRLIPYRRKNGCVQHQGIREGAPEVDASNSLLCLLCLSGDAEHREWDSKGSQSPSTRRNHLRHVGITFDTLRITLDALEFTLSTPFSRCEPCGRKVTDRRDETVTWPLGKGSLSNSGDLE